MSVCQIICFYLFFLKIDSNCIYVYKQHTLLLTCFKKIPNLWCFLFCLFVFSPPQWHALSREEQAKYYELARKERQLHMQLYPGWSARDNYVGSYVGGNFFSRACRNVCVTCWTMTTHCTQALSGKPQDSNLVTTVGASLCDTKTVWKCSGKWKNDLS